MKGSSAVAKILKIEGVKYLFCFPYNPLIEECAKIDIRPIVTRMERTLVNMADAYSRVLNGSRSEQGPGIGVTAVQCGPGAENAYPGIAQAFADGSPILFLPGGYNRDQRDTVPNFTAATSYRTVSKWSAQIATSELISPMIRRALTLLQTGRRAPVVLEIPEDIAQEEMANLDYTPSKPTKSSGNPADVREAIKMLMNAKRPVLHAGQGILWAEAWNELREFAELANIPVMTTLTGKSAFPEDHPLSLGTGGNSCTAMVAHFIRSADLVVGIGCSFTSSVFAVSIPQGATILHSTNCEDDLNKDVICHHAILGDAKLVLRQLIEDLKNKGGRRDDSVTAEIKHVKDAWLAEWMPRLTSDEEPINPYRVVRELSQIVDRSRTIITHDSGNPRDQLAPFWETPNPRGYIGWGKSTQLGSSLGFALGAKLAAPEKLVINFMGDTAFGMCGMDFETAVREKIPILTILLNNGAMGGYDRYVPVASEKYHLRFLTGDYCKTAEGLGLITERVTQVAEIEPALQRALGVVESGRAALVEFQTREDPTLSKFS